MRARVGVTQVLALGLLLVVAGLAAPPGASSASPSDYLKPRVFDATDPLDDVPEGDLARAAIQVDPNLGTAWFFANVVDGVDDTIVLGLGALDAGGTCQPGVEIVGGTGTTSWIVRNPGETTLPPHTTDYRERTVTDTRLLGVSPTCFTARTSTASGSPLDGVTDATVRLVPVTERDLTLFSSPSLLQEHAGHDFALHFRVADPYLDAEQWIRNPLYDLDIALTAGPGVTLDLTHVTQPSTSGYELGQVATAHVDAPGWHYVDVDATAGNGTPWHGRVYLWNVGGAHPPATGDLTGRGYWAHYLVADAEGDLSGSNAELWFVNRRFATTRTLRTGLPRCRHASQDCLRYRYDEAAGVLEIDGWRGLLTHGVLRWHPGLSSADDEEVLQEGPWFFDGLYQASLLPHWTGTHLPPGTYEYSFKPDETFSYRFAAHHRYTYVTPFSQHPVKGHYRLAGDHITLTPDHGHARTERLAVVSSPGGRPRPALGFLVRNVVYRPGT